MGCSNSSVNALLHQHSCQLKGFLHCLWSIINTRQDMQMRIDHILLPCKGPAATGNLSSLHTMAASFAGATSTEHLLAAEASTGNANPLHPSWPHQVPSIQG